MDKQGLRNWAKDKRKKLDMASISVVLTDKLAKTDEYKKSQNIMLFYPLKNEVNLLPLLKDKSKKFYLPRIHDKELECCPYCIEDKLCKSNFHTLEPICSACDKTVLDMVIVPALACDKQKYRLGYGGGYYDRFLGGNVNKNIIKIACIPSELLLESIYPEQHDIKMDLILTD